MFGGSGFLRLGVCDSYVWVFFTFGGEILLRLGVSLLPFGG